MLHNEPRFFAKIAETTEEFHSAQRLRYEVFVKELGGAGPLVDHENALEKDELDPYFDHLILYDLAKPICSTSRVVGVYRLLPHDKAMQLGKFYSEVEYDLEPLKSSGRRLLELGRSCLHQDYRGGSAMFYLWQALSDYVLERDIEILFGVASLHGTDISKLAEPLSLLHYNHLAPIDLRVQAKDPNSHRMDLIHPSDLNRSKAMISVPSLIKAYLRLGGVVGKDAYIDYAFNTTDVCLILDTKKLNTRRKRIYVNRKAL